MLDKSSGNCMLRRCAISRIRESYFRRGPRNPPIKWNRQVDGRDNFVDHDASPHLQRSRSRRAPSADATTSETSARDVRTIFSATRTSSSRPCKYGSLILVRSGRGGSGLSPASGMGATCSCLLGWRENGGIRTTSTAQ